MTNANMVIEDEDETIIVNTDARHIHIESVHGDIAIFMGRNLKYITSYVKDVKFTGFYNKNPAKVSKFKSEDGKRMVILHSDGTTMKEE